MTESKERCENCHYVFEYVPGTTICRRYAPKRGAHGAAEFPPVEPEGWCGEWEAQGPVRVDSVEANQVCPDHGLPVIIYENIIMCEACDRENNDD